MEERDKEAADTPKDDLPLELEQNPLSQQPDPYDWYDEFRVERWDGFRFSEQQRNAKPERKAFVKEWSAKIVGETNPQDFTSHSFWKWMIYTGGNAYRGKQCYKTSNEQGEEEQQAQDEDELTGVDESQLYPVWCFDRFGQSMTILPDGRRIFIAGEHEDWYDPDFFIYNDVVVISTNGDIEHIFGYPIEVFPPTDFHAAAYVPTQNAIYVIGNVGYTQHRNVGSTPVYKLDLSNWSIAKVETKGDLPGWISEAKATFEESTGSIILTGGKVWGSSFETNEATFVLDLTTLTWTKK